MAEEDKPLLQHVSFENKSLKVEVGVREDLSIEYADSFLVTHSDEEFILTFFQLQHPMAFTPEDAASLESIEALALARIALTPKRMHVFMQLLQQDWINFVAQRAAEQQQAQQPQTNAEAQESK